MPADGSGNPKRFIGVSAFEVHSIPLCFKAIERTGICSSGGTLGAGSASFLQELSTKPENNKQAKSNRDTAIIKRGGLISLVNL